MLFYLRILRCVCVVGVCGGGAIANKQCVAIETLPIEVVTPTVCLSHASFVSGIIISPFLCSRKFVPYIKIVFEHDLSVLIVDYHAKTSHIVDAQ